MTGSKPLPGAVVVEEVVVGIGVAADRGEDSREGTAVDPVEVRLSRGTFCGE